MAVASNTVLFFVLVVLAFIAFMYYLISFRTEYSMVWFSLMCLTWAMRSIFSNLYLIFKWFPDFSWYWVARVEYLTLYFITLFGMLFMSSLFPRDVNKVMRTFFVICCGIFSLVTLFTEPLLFTRFIRFYLALGVFLLLYAVFILIKANVRERSGARYMLGGLIFGILMFGYAILAYEGFINSSYIIYNVGFIILFLWMGFAMILRLKTASQDEGNDILTYDMFFKEDDKHG